MKIEYPFIKHIPIVTVMSGSHISEYAMMSWNTGNRDTLLYLPDCPFFHDEREIFGYKYRVAPDTAITGNGVKDTPVQSQSERDKTVAGNEGGSVRTTVGVKFPWS